MSALLRALLRRAVVVVLIGTAVWTFPQPRRTLALSPAVGWLDTVVAVNSSSGQILIQGWALTSDYPLAALGVRIKIDGLLYPMPSPGYILANTYRPDVGAAYPGYGDYHGFYAWVTAPPGVHTVCTQAQNSGVYNDLSGCRGYSMMPSPSGISFYMRNQSTSSASSKGCLVGSAVLNTLGTQRVTSVLGFGAPRSNGGTTNWTGVDYTSTDIRNLVDAFASGYISCAGSDTSSILTIGIATSNDSNTYTTSANGALWAALATNVTNDINASGWGARIALQGASDIEPSFNASVANSVAWVNAYLANTSRPFLPNNSLDGCPTSGTYVASTACNTPSSGGPSWTVENLWQVSSQYLMQPVPQIYTSAQAQQWYRISKYSQTTRGFPTYFRNTMSTQKACQQLGGCTGLAPAPAFDALGNVILTDSATYVLTTIGDTDVGWADLP
jgi:hypothetical protein